MTDKAVKARISGRVQGVCFRAWARDEARGLGLAGWVKNRPDGTVEAVFAGPAAHVDAILARCREGPFAARVETVDAEPVNFPAGAGFEVRY